MRRPSRRHIDDWQPNCIPINMEEIQSTLKNIEMSMKPTRSWRTKTSEEYMTGMARKESKNMSNKRHRATEKTCFQASSGTVKPKSAQAQRCLWSWEWRLKTSTMEGNYASSTTVTKYVLTAEGQGLTIRLTFMSVEPAMEKESCISGFKSCLGGFRTQRWSKADWK